jgi:sugar phosphate permease
MTKREVAFLPIALGSGLVMVLAFICFPEIIFFVFFWRHGFLLALFLVLIVGSIFVLRLRDRAKPVDSN